MVGAISHYSMHGWKSVRPPKTNSEWTGQDILTFRVQKNVPNCPAKAIHGYGRNFSGLGLLGVGLRGLITLIPEAESFVGVCRASPACSLTNRQTT